MKSSATASSMLPIGGKSSGRGCSGLSVRFTKSMKARTKENPVKSLLAAVALVPQDDPRLPAIRHLLAAALVKGGRYAEALEEFRRIGPWCGAEPWTHSPDPVLEFDHWRAVAALRA
jgi:hypothetical protein